MLRALVSRHGATREPFMVARSRLVAVVSFSRDLVSPCPARVASLVAVVSLKRASAVSLAADGSSRRAAQSEGSSCRSTRPDVPDALRACVRECRADVASRVAVVSSRRAVASPPHAVVSLHGDEVSALHDVLPVLHVDVPVTRVGVSVRPADVPPTRAVASVPRDAVSAKHGVDSVIGGVVHELRAGVSALLGVASGLLDAVQAHLDDVSSLRAPFSSVHDDTRAVH